MTRNALPLSRQRHARQDRSRRGAGPCAGRADGAGRRSAGARLAQGHDGLSGGTAVTVLRRRFQPEVVTDDDQKLDDRQFRQHRHGTPRPAASCSPWRVRHDRDGVRRQDAVGPEPRGEYLWPVRGARHDRRADRYLARNLPSPAPGRRSAGVRRRRHAAGRCDRGASDLGSGVIRGQECDHLAFRTARWTGRSGSRRATCRIPAASSSPAKDIAGWPQYTLDFSAWGDGPREADFAFVPPAGARQGRTCRPCPIWTMWAGSLLVEEGS